MCVFLCVHACMRVCVWVCVCVCMYGYGMCVSVLSLSVSLCLLMTVFPCFRFVLLLFHKMNYIRRTIIYDAGVKLKNKK